MSFLDDLGNSAFTFFGRFLTGNFTTIAIILGILTFLGVGYWVLMLIAEKNSWRMKLRIKKEVGGKRLEGFEYIPFRWHINSVTNKQTGLWELKEPKFFKSKIIPPCGKQISNNEYAIIIDEYGNIFDDEGEVFDVTTGKNLGVKRFSGIGIAFDRQRKNNKVLGGNIRENNLSTIFTNIIKIILIFGAIFLLFTILKNDYAIKQQSLSVTDKMLAQQNVTAEMLDQFERKLDLNEQYNKILFEKVFGTQLMRDVEYEHQLYVMNSSGGGV